MKFTKLTLAAVMAAMAGSVFALDTPRPGPFDDRVRFVDYNPKDVVKLVSHYGYQINVVLQEGEYVLDKGVFMGDPEAWVFGTKGNHIFIKPEAEKGATNLTVLTNKRAYTFDLSAHWSKKGSKSDDMYFQVNFRYPQEEAAAARAEAERKKAADALNSKLGQQYELTNFNYWVQGSDDLAPDAAGDDGRFTVLTFKGNRDIPAIYIVNEDGSESLANRTVEGDNIKVHALARKFVLRKGNSVACVFNESYNAVGNSNQSGTTVPGVERVIKGDNQ